VIFVRTLMDPKVTVTLQNQKKPCKIWAKRFDLIRFFGISYLVPVLNQVKIIDFARFSYFVPVLKQVKKMEKSRKKVFLTVYPRRREFYSLYVKFQNSNFYEIRKSNFEYYFKKLKRNFRKFRPEIP
jgi:hypothetical protein